MSDIFVEPIKDYGDGEVYIQTICKFTIFVPSMERTEIMQRIRDDFQKVMEKYVI